MPETEELRKTRQELSESRAELARRPTKRQATIGNTIAALVGFGIVLSLALLSKNAFDSAAEEAKSLSDQVAELESQNELLRMQADLLETVAEDNRTILDAIEKATGECSLVRSARSQSRILAEAADLIRDSHGLPRQEHPPLPELPPGCDEVSLVPPG